MKLLAIPLALFAATTTAHMIMSDPPAYEYKGNPNAAAAGIVDNDMAPLNGGSLPFPCKGHHKLLGQKGGESVATWEAGSSQSFTVDGSAVHGGGSCQASISTDGGATFKVVKSYIGNCPIDKTYPFTVPKDTKQGAAIFAWTWFDVLAGQPEMYMSCASITINGGAGSEKVAFDQRPDIFVGNIVAMGTCKFPVGKIPLFPNPGDDVQNGEGSEKAVLPDGDCKTPAPSAGGSSSGSSNPAAPAAPAPVSNDGQYSVPARGGENISPTISAESAGPAASAAVTPAVASAPASSSAATASPSSVPAAPAAPLTATSDGQCGANVGTCNGSVHGPSCSPFGWCGHGKGWYGEGCQPDFGLCGDEAEAAIKTMTFSDSVPAATSAAGTVVPSALAVTVTVTASIFITVGATQEAGPTTLQTITTPAGATGGNVSAIAAPTAEGAATNTTDRIPIIIESSEAAEASGTPQKPYNRFRRRY